MGHALMKCFLSLLLLPMSELLPGQLNWNRLNCPLRGVLSRTVLETTLEDNTLLTRVRSPVIMTKLFTEIELSMTRGNGDMLS